MTMKIIIFTCLLAVLQTRMVMGILGGEPARPGQFKNAVALQILVIARYKTFCGGTIIAKFWLLSTGECVEVIEGLYNPLEVVRVVAGTIHVRGNFIHAQYLGITIFEKHENFKRVGDDVDDTSLKRCSLVSASATTQIAIGEYNFFCQSYRRSSGVIISENRENLRESGIYIKNLGMIMVNRPGFIEANDIAIYPLSESEEYPKGFTKLVGWGALNANNTEIGDFPDMLYFLKAEFINLRRCRDLIVSVLMADDGLLFDTNLISSEEHICTGPLLPGFSMCDGDPGGPLLALDNRNNLRVVAIQSLQIGRCGRKYAPALHTNVVHYTGWMKSIQDEHQLRLSNV